VIDHISIPVTDIARSRAFYAEALAPLAIVKDYGEAVGFGVPEGFGGSLDPGGDFWISQGTALVPRLHFAFGTNSPAVVDAAYAAALHAGGIDNGSPGPRPQYHAHYYAAFVLDPDGHNFEFVCHTGA
jgi:catechol 2,3-dioxygenase-like lactoylglutathione lyase family enzyme